MPDASWSDSRTPPLVAMRARRLHRHASEDATMLLVPRSGLLPATIGQHCQAWRAGWMGEPSTGASSRSATTCWRNLTRRSDESEERPTLMDASARVERSLGARFETPTRYGDSVVREFEYGDFVETSGLEPPTPCLQSRCSSD